jgi:hypothetical protein
LNCNAINKTEGNNTASANLTTSLWGLILLTVSKLVSSQGFENGKLIRRQSFLAIAKPARKRKMFGSASRNGRQGHL